MHETSLKAAMFLFTANIIVLQQPRNLNFFSIQAFVSILCIYSNVYAKKSDKQITLKKLLVVPFPH